MVRKRIEVEEKILRTMRYFGIEATSMEKHIRDYNPDAKTYFYHCPFAKTEVKEEVEKEFDLVYFAKIVRMKGIEDLIKALPLVKQVKPDVKLEIIGKGDERYIEYLKQLITELGLNENIAFRGFIPTQREVHTEVKKARISVLPTYNDTLPGTIIESMLLGLPVISYHTGGIPDLNMNGEHVILVGQGNTGLLAGEIISLLQNTVRQKELSEKGREYVSVEFDNTRSIDMQIKACREVIQDFKEYPGN